MCVRPFQEKDSPALARLLAEMGYPTSDHEALAYARAFIAHPGGAVLVAVQDCDVVGVAACALVPRLDADRLSCRITDLVVAKSFRRRGIGTALIDSLERWAGRAGARRLDLSTGDWRADAHAFYERLGFTDNARALVRRLEVRPAE